MKKLVLAFGALLFSMTAFALTDSQVYKLNRGSGTAWNVQLGTLLDSPTFFDLASGKIIVGSSGGVGAAVDLSGDATISNLGSLSIAAGAVTEAKITSQAVEGLHVMRVARVTYDVATDLGTVAAHALGVTLPAKTLITRSYMYIVTQFVDAGAGTVAISCEDANNIKTATDITGTAAGGLIEGQSTGAASAFVDSIAAACEVTATVATAAQTAGKAIIFIEYVVVE